MKTPQGPLELCILAPPLPAKCLLKVLGTTEAPLTLELPVLLGDAPCIRGWGFPSR